MFNKFLVAAAEKKVKGSFNFQLAQYKRGIIVTDVEVVYDPGGFLSAGQRPSSRRCHDDIKVRLIQS